MAAAAGSLARLTHRDPPSLAGACLVALALHDALAGAGNAGDAPALAARWGGSAPPGEAEAAARAAVAALDRPADVDPATDDALRALGYA
jgi:ADP-ribosylglycohydrolase